MTEINQIYKCNVCGNIVEIVHTGAGELVCCGQPMKLQQENTVDAAQEKHVPVVENTKSGIKVKVGSIAHPMEEDHFIEWIEALVKRKVYRKFLKPGESREAEFLVPPKNIEVREYCNLHGLWKS